MTNDRTFRIVFRSRRKRQYTAPLTKLEVISYLAESKGNGIVEIRKYDMPIGCEDTLVLVRYANALQRQ